MMKLEKKNTIMGGKHRRVGVTEAKKGGVRNSKSYPSTEAANKAKGF